MTEPRSRCDCRGSTGKKIGYRDQNVLDEVQQRLSQELGKPLYAYDCPQGNGQHLSRMSPEERAAQLARKLEHAQRQDAFDRTLVLSPSPPMTPLNQLMWRADQLATGLRGRPICSRDDLVILLYHPMQGWQASAPVKPIPSRDRWVRVQGMTPEEAVSELIKRLDLLWTKS